jgi:hypothetical protein
MSQLSDGVVAGVIGGLAGSICAGLITFATNKTNRTATRLEKRLDDIEAATEALRIEAVAYWLSPGRDEKTERLIKLRWETLVSRLSGARTSKIPLHALDDASSSADALFETITGDDFEVTGRVAKPAKVQEIRNICDELCGHVQKSRTMARKLRYFWKRWQLRSA